MSKVSIEVEGGRAVLGDSRGSNASADYWITNKQDTTNIMVVYGANYGNMYYNNSCSG